MEAKGDYGNYKIDFVVTPKQGSPILGYEFAKLIEKPFVLHEEIERFKGMDNDMRAVFDCHAVPKKGAVALIVDDSTTGGTMVCNTVRHLRKYGYKVYNCLVVFEPKNKRGRERLAAEQIGLLSIIETHNE